MPLPLLPIGLMAGSALAGGLGSLLSKKGRFDQKSLLTPQQQQAQQQSLGLALQGLQNPYAGFAPIEQNARNQFQTQTIPSIAERFTALGGQRSSGFQNALQQGAVGLESNLAALKSNYGLQNQSLMQNLLGLGMRPSFEYAYRQPEPGFLGGALGGLSQGLGSLGTLGLGQSLGMYGAQQGFGGLGSMLPGLQASAPEKMMYLQQLRSLWGL